MNDFYETQTVYQAVVCCPGGCHINIYTGVFLKYFKESAKLKWVCSYNSHLSFTKSGGANKVFRLTFSLTRFLIFSAMSSCKLVDRTCVYLEEALA